MGKTICALCFILVFMACGMPITGRTTEENSPQGKIWIGVVKVIAD